MSTFQQTSKKIEEAVVGGYQAIERGVVSGYQKIENGVVSGYKKVEDKFIDAFLAEAGETIEEARARITGAKQEERK